jgi:enoyl-[acyl-carrier protein] reductase I
MIKSIAWQVALKCHEQGAQFVLTNAPVAMRMGEIKELASACNNAQIIPCDVSKNEDMENLIDKSMEILGGKIDFILHSVGMSMNIRKGNEYTNLDYKFMHETLDISAISFHRLLATCYKKDAINDWGSVIALTYIAAQRVSLTTVKWLRPNRYWKVLQEALDTTMVNWKEWLIPFLKVQR